MTPILLTIAAAAALGGLALLGARGRWLVPALAAFAVAGLGFALAGTPRAVLPETRQQPIPLTEARHVFYGNFSTAERWHVLSEGLARGGHSADAVGILQNAVRRYPGDAQLWVALGNALVDHARAITPPAEFAYRRAAALTPGYPGPQFFRALALARFGDRAKAARIWREMLDRGPADAAWRPMVRQGLALIGDAPAVR